MFLVIFVINCTKNQTNFKQINSYILNLQVKIILYEIIYYFMCFNIYVQSHISYMTTVLFHNKNSHFTLR